MGLGERRSRILAAVVNDYVTTAEPIGSEHLAQRYDFGVKPATIRNELAAMSDLGYLRQPHTSAGRVPSDLGYRYYVDELMPDPSLDPGETSQAERCYDPYDGEIDSILHQTCRILSDLTKYTSLATPPQTDTFTIKHVAVSAVSRGKLLVVTVLNTGHIDHRMLDFPESLNDVDLVTISNLVNARFQGAGLETFAACAEEDLPSNLQRLTTLYKKVTSVMKQALLLASEDEIYMDGTTRMLRQPEFAEGSRAATVLDALEQRTAVFQMLSRALLGRYVSVVIGSENSFEELRDCSFVTSCYYVGDKACGSIGVVGPTRMDYRRAVAAVRLMSSNLSQLLTRLSIG